MGFGRDTMDRVANHKTTKVTDVYDRYGYVDEDSGRRRAAGHEPRRADRGRERRQPEVAATSSSRPFSSRQLCRIDPRA
jgi:hypothetical protein